MRRPEINSLFLPICASVSVSCLPAAVDHGDLVAVAHQVRDGLAAGVQQRLVFDRRATEFDHELHRRPSDFVPSAHQVHVLHRLAGCALEQVVETRDQHQTLAVLRQLEADVAVVGADDVLDLGQVRRSPYAHHGAGRVERAQAGFDLVGTGPLRKPHIDRRKNPARNRQQMRRELKLLRSEMELLQHLAHVAMAEDRVRGEIVCRVHEVTARCGGLTHPAHSGLGIADDAVIEIGQPRSQQRRKREDDRGGVTAGIGDQARLCARDLLAMELRAAEDGLSLQRLAQRRIGVVQLVDGAVSLVFQSPRTTEVDDADTILQPLGRPLARGLMGQREEDDLNAGVAYKLPVEGDDLGQPLAFAEGELGVNVFERDATRGGVVRDPTEKERLGRGEARMREQKPRQLPAGITTDAGHGCANGCGWVLHLRSRWRFEFCAWGLHVNQSIPCGRIQLSPFL
jgi:hypothetical protein